MMNIFIRQGISMNMNKEYMLDLLTQLAPNPYLQAFLIIFIFIGLAKVLDLIVTRFIKGWLEKNTFDLDETILNIFHKPVFITIILIGFGLSIERLGLKENIHFIISSGLKTIGILIWLSAIIKITKLILGLLSKDESRFKLIQERTLPLFHNLFFLLIIGLSCYVLFLVWDIDLTAWMASAGILGLAVSFAAKDTLANLFSGVFIMADTPYKLGDFLILESGERGNVTNIGIRSTRILTRDDVEITIPNSIMGNTKIINEAGGRHEKFRIRVKVGVAYGSDIDRVHDVLLDEARQNKRVCENPTPRVRFRNFGDSSLEHELLCWVKKPVFRGKVLHQLNTAVYKRFIKENIKIPFPQRDIHVVTNTPD
jgi:MscS family membrane protein